MKQRTEFNIERSDVQREFGGVSLDELAATIYNAFHGHCECASHPFIWGDNEDFHGYLPWDKGRPCSGDDVVQAFRLAAIAAYDTLKATGVGSLS